MAPDMAPDMATGLKNLDILIQSSVSLLQQLQSALADIHRAPNTPLPAAQKPATPSSGNDGKSEPPPGGDQVDAISLAGDSASLIRAHTTKLSLLVVNEPFTPGAIISVIRDLIGGPIPGLASSVETCLPERYTAVYRRELAWRCRAVFLELDRLLQKIPRDGKALPGDKEGFLPNGKGSIALTGVLWSACDDVSKLVNMGVAGLFTKKVEEYRDTLKDTMEELKEWGDEEPDDDDEEDEGEEGGNEDKTSDVDALADELRDSHITSTQDTQDMIDDMMNSNQTIPKSDPEKIRPRLELSLKRLRLVTLLYQAIVKRRIKKLPSVPPKGDATGSLAAIPQRLDEIVEVLKVLPDRFGDLACAFYELESEEIDSLMEQCFLDAFAASELLSQTWDGGDDEFTAWTKKFQSEIKSES